MDKMQVAKTILEQLGGSRFLAMTGAKNLAGSEKALTFRIGKNKSKANLVKIELTAADDYTVTFYRVEGVYLKEVEQSEGIYFDQLQALFTEVTGLYTRL